MPTLWRYRGAHSQQALRGEYDHSKDGQYTYYAIANKLLREFEAETISTTLDAPELTLGKQAITDLRAQVEVAFESLSVDSFTLEANPTVGYLQQNKLYADLLAQDNLARWALPHPMAQNLYAQLLKVCSALNESGIFLPKNSSVAFACVIAKKWVQGDSLRSIISEQMDRNKDRSCNKNVRDVIKTINDDIRFKMASALRCYQLLYSNATQERGIENASVKLHGFIEAGGWEERFVQLVNFGLSRETAVEVHTHLQNEITVSSFDQLRTLYENGVLSSIHPITKKEIEKLFL